MKSFAQFDKDYEYNLFVEALTHYENGTNLNELAMPSFIKKKVEFVKNVAVILKKNFNDMVNFFKEKVVFQFFKAIKWSFDRIFKIMKAGWKAFKTVQKVIFDYMSNTVVGKWTTKELAKLDEYLKTHKKTKRMGGVVVSGMLIYIWFNMTFCGDVGYDFDMGDILSALAGKFSLATIFGGPEGAKLLTLFITGVIGLSFPWPGPSSVQFIGAIVLGIGNKVKAKFNPLKEAIKRDDSQSGIKGFKNQGTASKAGKVAGKNKSDDAMRKHNDAMIDAALKQDKKAFDKSAKTVAKLFHKMYGQTMKIQTMWSVKKAKAMKDGSFWKMPISQRNKL